MRGGNRKSKRDDEEKEKREDKQRGREIKWRKDRERERVMEQRSEDYRIVGGDDDSAANSEGSIS